MKLRVKISILTAAVLLLAMGLSGAAVIYRSSEYIRRETIESYESQLNSAAYALGRELEREALEKYSEAAHNSYINFLIKKFDSSQYILIQENREVCNLTPFFLENPGDERFKGSEAATVIQRTNNKRLLISGKKLLAAAGEDYSLVLVKDISSLYEEIRRQLYFYMGIYAAAAALAVVLILLFAGKILKPLKELGQAAEGIRLGHLERRADVHSKDEVGMMAVSFNQMADKIEEQVEELSRVSEQRRQMLGSLTHELKTPMTSVIGYSDTLLHVNLKEEQKKRALLHIYEECSRLERLSGKLMSLIGMYDNDSIALEEADMKELFEHVARLEQQNLNKRKLRLQYSCEMGKKQIDRDLFESLLVNLIDNAAKASPEGKTIYLEGKGNTISVRDYGCGIPEGELSLVMEAFYMVDKARSRREGGSGLGLALCSRIAALHHAKLFIESKEGEGTCVSVVF